VCVCVLRVFKCHRNFPVGAKEVWPATLCDPGIQSHALDVSSLLLRFVRRPDELGRGAEVGAAAGTDASRSAGRAAANASASSCTSVITIAGVAADAVCGRAASRRLQAQQGARVLRRRSQDGSP